MNEQEFKQMRLRKMIEEVEGYAILLLDKEGHVETWNKGAEKIKGYTAEEIIGKSFSVFYTAEDRENLRPLKLLRTAAEKGSASDEGWRVKKDGSLFWANILITAVHDTEGRIIGYTKVTRDLTGLKKSEDKAKIIEQRNSRMIAEIKDYAIITLDVTGNIENWNSGAEMIKGYTAEEIVGKNFRIFYPDEDRNNKFPDTFLEEARVNGRASHEGWRVRKDGTYFWGAVVITAIHDDEGKLTGFVKVTRDLTEKKRAEEAQQRYLEQLELRAREMEQFAYIASHDLQEPLRTINSFLDLFDMKYTNLVDEEGRMYIDVILQSAARMRELVRAVLDYSVLGVNKEIVTVDCNQLVTDIKNDLHAAIEAGGATIETEPLPVIRGYHTELRQLFQNVISNALKFKRSDVTPVIKIAVVAEGDKWHFTIEDNGIGMDNRVMNKIFQIFQRLHPKGQYPGSGIGLSYAKKIVELHNGRIWVTSEPGVGSCFHFTLSNL
jgi:PAS domain S-box-containing protein